MQKIVPIFILFIVATYSLHLQDNTATQIQALLKQQSTFQTKINQLLSDITDIEKNVEDAASTDQRIIILQSAIKSERAEIYDLSTTIIPPFNLSKQSCQRMTDQQKVDILEKLYKTKDQVVELQKMTQTLPQCQPVSQMKSDIQKQLFFLQSIESIVYTKCQRNVLLGPTIFQTNIYADGWILGKMTIDDLIDQYFQRSMKYDNITNCPFQKPFFDGKKCIVCPKDNPVFNIEQKKCVSCPKGTRPDNKLRKCVQIQHFTNWQNVQNFYPMDAELPKQYPAQATACQKETPYFNGKKCIACKLPNYFDIQKNQCLQCAKGSAFDLNERQCLVIQKNSRTKLSGNDWVTDSANITKVLSDRAKLLQQDQTTQKLYEFCQQENPYYDGLGCINCQEEEKFNIDSLQCQKPPVGSAYNKNMRTFLPIQQKQTNPDAQNIIGQLGQGDEKVPYCDSQRPYFDGNSCVACQSPFILFDIQSKSCVVCDPITYYDSQKKSCQNRQTIYISKNKQGLMATQATSIQDYEQSVKQKIDNNPQAILLNCQNPQDYSDFTKCFPCQQYFNIQTKQCSTCDGQLDQKSICKNDLYLFTNPDAQNIKNAPSQQDRLAQIQKAKKNHPNTKICEAQTPYSDGSKCFNCQDPLFFFDYSDKKCVGCKQDTYYKDGQCLDKVYVTNIDGLEQYLANPPDFTKQKIVQQVEQIKKNAETIECPQQSPYFDSETQKCIGCTQQNYYLNLQTKQCEQCLDYDSQKKYCVPPPPQPKPIPKYPNLGNPDWIIDQGQVQKVLKLRDQLKAVQNSQQCPQQTPFYNPTQQKCLDCQQNQYFNYDKYICQQCPQNSQYNINVHKCLQPFQENTYDTNLQTPNLIYGGLSENQLKDQYNERAQKYPAINDCPEETPFYDGISCIKCPVFKPLFDIHKRLCTKCPDESKYDEKRKQCVSTQGATVKTDPNPAKMYANIF